MGTWDLDVQRSVVTHHAAGWGFQGEGDLFGEGFDLCQAGAHAGSELEAHRVRGDGAADHARGDLVTGEHHLDLVGLKVKQSSQENASCTLERMFCSIILEQMF